MNNVAVIGACGKMGRGIALLLLQEMALEPSLSHLQLIDTNVEEYYNLKVYLRHSLTRFAEKNINRLRALLANDPKKVSNEEMIQAFLERALALIDCSPYLLAVKDAELIFEAVYESVPLKVEVLKEVRHLAPKGYVFTNTSSIPIGYLAEKSDLGPALIGYHFYNPPAVQKLLEIIPSASTSPKLEAFAFALGKRLDKIMVKSADVAGFIGNGHFAHEIVYATKLARTHSPQLIDRVTRDYLLRPMGIFQLMKYVGLPVAQEIMHIMNLECDLSGLEAQKFSESKNLSFSLSWEKIKKNPHLLKELPHYFQGLAYDSSEEAKLAIAFLKHSKSIVEDLVQKKVAASKEDVGLVLKNGFNHLYSPHEVI